MLAHVDSVGGQLMDNVRRESSLVLQSLLFTVFDIIVHIGQFTP